MESNAKARYKVIKDRKGSEELKALLIKYPHFEPKPEVVFKVRAKPKTTKKGKK